MNGSIRKGDSLPTVIPLGPYTTQRALEDPVAHGRQALHRGSILGRTSWHPVKPGSIEITLQLRNKSKPLIIIDNGMGMLINKHRPTRIMGSCIYCTGVFSIAIPRGSKAKCVPITASYIFTSEEA